MLQDARGSVDGINSQGFSAGEVYEINDELGNVFVNQMQVAVVASEPKKSVEAKAIDSASENKAIDTATENKSKKVK